MIDLVTNIRVRIQKETGKLALFNDITTRAVVIQLTPSQADQVMEWMTNVTGDNQ